MSPRLIPRMLVTSSLVESLPCGVAAVGLRDIARLSCGFQHPERLEIQAATVSEEPWFVTPSVPWSPDRSALGEAVGIIAGLLDEIEAHGQAAGRLPGQEVADAFRKRHWDAWTDSRENIDRSGS